MGKFPPYVRSFLFVSLADLFPIHMQTLQREQNTEQWPAFEDMVKSQRSMADLAASRKSEEEIDRADHAKGEVDKVKVFQGFPLHPQPHLPSLISLHYLFPTLTFSHSFTVSFL